jgi:hypothetical protein
MLAQPSLEHQGQGLQRAALFWRIARIERAPFFKEPGGFVELARMPPYTEL